MRSGAKASSAHPLRWARDVRFGSLFSGVGLLDVGLAQAGIEHAWFCESSDEFVSAVDEFDVSAPQHFSPYFFKLPVQTCVLRSRNYDQIFRSVVSRVAIDVMNYFAGLQMSSCCFFGDKNVLVDISRATFLVGKYSYVSRSFVDRATATPVSMSWAKDPSLSKVWESKLATVHLQRVVIDVERDRYLFCGHSILSHALHFWNRLFHTFFDVHPRILSGIC